MHTWIGAAIALLGLVLLAYMVAVEGEPGALPLALVLVGGVWIYLARRRRQRTRGPAPGVARKR